MSRRGLRVGVQPALRPGRPVVDELVEQARAVADAGLDVVWMGQGFELDSLTALAVVGREVPGIEVGVQVVPTWPRHPLLLASQALTVQAATGGRLTLGIGLSHPSTVERTWGLRFADPIGHLEETLAVLAAAFAGERVRHEGDSIRAALPWPMVLEGAVAPRLVAGVLGPRALQVAGRMCDGVLTTFTGPCGLADHVVPIVREAACAAGRPAPAIITTFPLAVTDDIEGARAGVEQAFGGLVRLPSYAATLERQGAGSVLDVSAIGDEAAVRDHLRALADAGATEVSPFLVGPPADHARALALLGELVNEVTLSR